MIDLYDWFHSTVHLNIERIMMTRIDKVNRSVNGPVDESSLSQGSTSTQKSSRTDKEFTYKDYALHILNNLKNKWTQQVNSINEGLIEDRTKFDTSTQSLKEIEHTITKIKTYQVFINIIGCVTALALVAVGGVMLSPTTVIVGLIASIALQIATNKYCQNKKHLVNNQLSEKKISNETHNKIINEKTNQIKSVQSKIAKIDLKIQDMLEKKFSDFSIEANLSLQYSTNSNKSLSFAEWFFNKTYDEIATADTVEAR